MRKRFSIELAPGTFAYAQLTPVVQGVATLTEIEVPAHYRGRGIGANILRQLLEAADYEGVTIRLEISAYGRRGVDMGNPELCKWYERHGFVRTNLKTLDYNRLYERTPQT